MFISSTVQPANQEGIDYQEFSINRPGIQNLWSLEVISKSVDYLIIPDGMIDLVFEQHEGILYNPEISAPFKKLVKIRLNKDSKYLGIRFLPGQFRRYFDVDLQNLHKSFTEFKRREYRNLTDFFGSLKKIKTNPLAKYDNNLDFLISSALSQRQKRRIFKQSTGFTIREFNKIQRFQRSLVKPNEINFYDQSHKIKTYKQLVGMTPPQLGNIL